MLIIFMTLFGLMSHAICLDPYDFIIVGGGTAGLALSRRLSENGKYRVIVLEAGGLPKENMDVPAYATSFLTDSDVTFRYYSTPQPQLNTAAGNNKVVPVISGRMLGGTSMLNLMYFNRGSPQDFNNWANITKDQSWNYSNMLKYFRRIENYEGDFQNDQHGYHGPLSVSQPKYRPGQQAFLAAGRALGYPVADPNGPQRISFGPAEFSKKHGRRASSFSGYVEPILSTTPNLEIVINTNVTEILFEGNKAVGVRFQTKSKKLQEIPDNCLYATKEIILSGGAYGSALLLLRSGVGPRNALRSAGVPLVKELPVGVEFQDHVSTGLPIIINNRAVVMDNERDLNPANWELYQKVGDGPYSTAIGSTSQAFMASSVAFSEGQSDWADMHVSLSASTGAFYATGLGNDSILAPWEAGMTAAIYLTRPKSRGSLALNPVDIYGPPILDVAYVRDPRDMQILIEAIKETLKIFEETLPFRKLGARLAHINLPACNGFHYRSTEYWNCFVRQTAQTGCHPGSTNRMGHSGDPGAVVDSKLRVIGVIGLRVVDASVMPVITNANTQAPVYAIAEKASDMILERWEGRGIVDKWD